MESINETPAPGLPRGRQLGILSMIALAVMLLFVVLPWGWHTLFDKPEPVAAAPADGTFAATDKEWATLRFATVHARIFETAATTDGMIATDDDLTTQVFSPFTGLVTHVYAKAGDAVQAGSPLFAVRASEFVQGQSDLVTAKGGLHAAQAQLKLAQAAEARQHDLYNHQGTALKDWQQAQVDLANAQAGLGNAENALASVKNRLRILGKSDAEIAALGQGGASSSKAETIVRAPVAGLVTQRLIGEGQNIGSVAGSGSATQAFTISNFKHVWVVGNLREEDAEKAHVGQEATVQLLANPDQIIHTHISYVAPALDPVSRRLTVRATLDNADGRFKPQMYATFSLLTGAPRNNLSVPESAVIYEGSNAHVWVARPRDKHLGLREVSTGKTLDGQVEILSGLREGEVVVTAGSLFIDRGAKAD